MAVPNKEKVLVVLQVLLMVAWVPAIDGLQVKLPENIRWIALFAAGFGILLILVAVWQLKTHLSAFPTPKEGAKLLTSGAFSFCRHPIYSGLLFAAFGLGIWMNSGYKLLVSLVLLVFFVIKSSYEEKQLQARFSEYSEYKRDTGRFFPKFNWRI